MQQATSTTAIGNANDVSYDSFLAAFRARFTGQIESGAQPLFTTDAEGLFAAYLAGFPEGKRQHHNCHACRHFIDRFSGLVTINELGLTAPAALAGADIDEEYRASFEAMAKIVRRAKITGVFLSADQVLGTPRMGSWTHLHVTLPATVLVPKRDVLSPFRKMAAKSEDYRTVSRALAEFDLSLLELAMQLLDSEQLYRSEKVAGPARWLRDLHVARSLAANKANVVWRAIATAPAGFCHPRTSMIGALLEDIAAGKTFDEVSASFAKKMKPDIYQRPQAAPAAGTIAQAERLVEQMDIAASLRRRYARLEEIETIWKPTPAPAAAPTGGVFGHLKAKDVGARPEMKLPPVRMTWSKFEREVLPTAQEIDFFVHNPGHDAYFAFATAVDPAAPPILQWDIEARRNPVSWYLWVHGSRCTNWGLRHLNYHRVSGIALQPSMWGGSRDYLHQGESVFFVLADARESVPASLALFPEILKGELHGVRAVIEAHSNSRKMEDMAQGDACGIRLQKGAPWNYRFRVTAADRQAEYVLDRWD